MAKKSVSPDLIGAINAAVMQRNLQSFDKRQFRLTLWLMFIAADILETSTLNLADQLKSVNLYNHEDKARLEKVIRTVHLFIRDVDRQCPEDFACSFGELADECFAMLSAYIANKHASIDKKLPLKY